MGWVVDAPNDGEIPDGCVWLIEGDCRAERTLSDDAVRLARQAAVEILWAATARRFGVCPVTVRPCPPAPERDWFVNHWDLISSTGHRTSIWYGNMACQSCSDTCRCDPIGSVRLWHQRPQSIVQVSIDGEVLDPSAYLLHNDVLVRIDGDSWPKVQDVTAPLGQPGTWSISYLYGTPVPVAGQLAAGELACEIAKALCDDDSCALPQRVQTVTRQGVTVGFIDPMTFLSDNKTGLYGVDLWIQSVNPNGLKQRPRVRRADDPRRRRRR